MASFIVLLSFTVLPVLTIASPNPLPLPALLSPLSARSLEGRQFDPSTAGTPAQCQSVCLPAFNAIDACDGTVACVCSASTVAGMKSCYGCVYGSDSAGENAALDAYTQDICAQAEPPVSGPTSIVPFDTSTAADATATPPSAVFPLATASSIPANAPIASPAAPGATSSGVTVNVPASTSGSGIGAGFTGGASARGAGALAVSVLGVAIGLAGVLVL